MAGPGHLLQKDTVGCDFTKELACVLIWDYSSSFLSCCEMSENVMMGEGEKFVLLC